MSASIISFTHRHRAALVKLIAAALGVPPDCPWLTSRIAKLSPDQLGLLLGSIRLAARHELAVATGEPLFMEAAE